MQDGARVRVESQHHAGAVHACGLLAQETQDADMPEVHAVERADGHHRGFPLR